jgi:hypothetical protein
VKIVLPFAFIIFVSIQLISQNLAEDKIDSDYAESLYYHVDPELIPAVWIFINKAEAHGFNVRQNIKNTKIYFKDLSKFGTGSLAGICYENSNKVFIDPGYWQSPEFSAIKRQNLILHELGHCVLGREHDQSKTYIRSAKSFKPNSIMYPKILNDDEYLSKINQYDDELFDQSRFFEAQSTIKTFDPLMFFGGTNN